jgi:hypothetical protein
MKNENIKFLKVDSIELRKKSQEQERQKSKKFVSTKPTVIHGIILPENYCIYDQRY